MENRKINKKFPQKLYIKNSNISDISITKYHMSNHQISMLEIIHMAEQSSKRMDKSRKKQLKNAITNNNYFYIENEFCNVSTFDIFKMLLKKAKLKFL